MAGLGNQQGGVAQGDGSLVGERKHKYIKNTNTHETQKKTRKAHMNNTRGIPGVTIA